MKEKKDRRSAEKFITRDLDAHGARLLYTDLSQAFVSVGMGQSEVNDEKVFRC